MYECWPGTHLLGLCFQSNGKAGWGRESIAKIICQSNDLVFSPLDTGHLCSEMYSVVTDILQGPAGLQWAVAQFLPDDPCPSSRPRSHTRVGARWSSDATTLYNKCLGTPTHTGVSSASQILLEAPCFSDDASVAQSQEGLPGSSLRPGAHRLDIGKEAHFPPWRVDWILGNT